MDIVNHHNTILIEYLTHLECMGWGDGGGNYDSPFFPCWRQPEISKEQCLCLIKQGEC